MDFKSMLASLWVPFFVLLAFIPGSTLNAVERKNTTKMTVPFSTDLANTITKIERKTPSLLHDAINDKTIQQSLSLKESTQDIEAHHYGLREHNEQKAMEFDNATGEVQLTSTALTTLLTSVGIEYRTTTPTETTSTGKPVKFTTTKQTTNNTRKNIRTGMFAMMNASFSMERKDLLIPPTKELELASTITSTILLQIAPISAATTTIEENITTTTPKTTTAPLRIPWKQVTKASVVSHPVAFETPIVFFVEKRTLNNNNNNNNTKYNSTSLSNNNNNNNLNKVQNKFNMSMSWKSTTTEILIDDTTASPPPQPLPSPKYFHGSPNRNQQYHQQIDNKKRLSSHIYKSAEHITSTRDMASECMEMGCITAINGSLLLSKISKLTNETYSTISTALPLSMKSTSTKDTAPTTEIPLLTSTTATTIMKSTTKPPRRIVATTTLKPPPAIDDYRTIISQAGTHAYLPCNVKQLVKKPISWLRVRDGHILTVDQTTFIADQRFQSVYSPNPERWSLQIKFVQTKDAGIYECQVSTEPKTSAIVNLHIIEPKTELLGESTRHVKAGSQVKLRCIISQALEPPLFINWFYNQKQIYLHNHKGWRTEIERIDLPPQTTTTTMRTTTTTTIRPTSTTTIEMTTLPSLTTPMTVIAGVGDTDNDDSSIGNAEISSVSESTMASGATITHFSSSVLYDGNAETVSSTYSTMLPIPPTELRAPSTSTTTRTTTTSTSNTMALNTMAAVVGMADVKQITAASLIIASVGKQDSGNYTCSPSNSAPRTVVLHVLNGEYSASAITSGSSTQILMAYNILLQWRHGTTAILILLWVIKLLVSLEFQWTCIQVRNKGNHDIHI